MEVNQEDLLKMFASNGWAGLNGQQEAVSEEDKQKAAAVDDDLNKAIAATFRTASGKKTMEWLRKSTIDQPSFNPQLGLVAILQGFTREGQNSIVRDIDRRINMVGAKK